MFEHNANLFYIMHVQIIPIFIYTIIYKYVVYVADLSITNFSRRVKVKKPINYFSLNHAILEPSKNNFARTIDADNSHHYKRNTTPRIIGRKTRTNILRIRGATPRKP